MPTVHLESAPIAARRRWAARGAGVCLAAVLALTCLPATAAAPAGSGAWHTRGNQILDANDQPVRLAGVNWYGFETADAIAHGLWAQDYHAVLNQIKAGGYNVVRLPFSNQMVESPFVPSNYSRNSSSGPINTDLQGLNSLEIMDRIVAGAGAVGLRVILDNHRSEAGNSAESNGLWYTAAFPESTWIDDWVALTQRYADLTDADGNPIVIGMDLRNEPHNAHAGGACWTGDSLTACPEDDAAHNWPAAAARAGNAILAVNPDLLIFVEGTDCFGVDCDWWGGNLTGVRDHPVSLAVEGRLVYSAHDYGPSEYRQPWFGASTTPDDLQAVWTKYWGYISEEGIAPVWLGEFGTPNTAADVQDAAPGSQGQWFRAITDWLQRHPEVGWTYWALNGEDRYGLLDSQYAHVANATKQSMLAAIQSQPVSPSSP